MDHNIFQIKSVLISLNVIKEQLFKNKFINLQH